MSPYMPDRLTSPSSMNFSFEPSNKVRSIRLSRSSGLSQRYSITSEDRSKKSNIRFASQIQMNTGSKREKRVSDADDTVSITSLRFFGRKKFKTWDNVSLTSIKSNRSIKSTRSHDLRNKKSKKPGIKFDEGNIFKTHHPTNRKYGSMSIYEYKTPFPKKPIQDSNKQESAQVLRTIDSAQNKIYSSTRMSSSFTRKEKETFAMKRKRFHHNEFIIAMQGPTSNRSHPIGKLKCKNIKHSIDELAQFIHEDTDSDDDL